MRTAKQWLRDQIHDEWDAAKVQQCALLLLNRVSNADVESLYEDELEFVEDIEDES